MAWRFDPFLGDIVFQKSKTIEAFDGLIDFGSEVDGDLELSCGLRENEFSIVDQGLRIIEQGG